LVVLGAVPPVSSQSPSSPEDTASIAKAVTRLADEYVREFIAAFPQYAQLTAYDTGALEMLALREQAERELGDRFDIREFHDQLLANGAITLPMLRR
jgi:uncharacterized protein (DUF885 family)